MRRAIVIGAPVALAVVEVWHPQFAAGAEQTLLPVADRWLAIHLIQLPLLVLLALALYLLVAGVDSAAATIARLGSVVFAALYSALDAVAGIATGVLAKEAAGLESGHAPSSPPRSTRSTPTLSSAGAPRCSRLRRASRGSLQRSGRAGAAWQRRTSRRRRAGYARGAPVPTGTRPAERATRARLFRGRRCGSRVRPSRSASGVSSANELRAVAVARDGRSQAAAGCCC